MGVRIDKILLWFLFLQQIVAVQAQISEPQITCNSSSMSITFNKTELDLQNQNYKFHFFNETSESCMVNSTTIKQNDSSLTASFDQCGINLYEVGNNSIVYNQTVILYFFNTSIVISGETSYKVQCVKDNNQTASHLNGAIQVTINEDNIVKCKFWFILWNCFLRLFWKQYQHTSTIQNIRPTDQFVYLFSRFAYSYLWNSSGRVIFLVCAEISKKIWRNITHNLLFLF